jgi:hypothetical protein
MKVYLLVSGFVSIYAITVYIIRICLLPSVQDISRVNESNIVSKGFTDCTVAILFGFQVVWTLLGGIAFWTTIYRENNCDKNVSTYIFVSLIMKIVSAGIGFITYDANNL